MRSLGLAIWQAWEPHIRLWLQRTRLFSSLLAWSLLMPGAGLREASLPSVRWLKRQGINIPHRMSLAMQWFTGLSLVENQDQIQQLSVCKTDRKSETSLVVNLPRAAQRPTLKPLLLLTQTIVLWAWFCVLVSNKSCGCGKERVQIRGGLYFKVLCFKICPWLCPVPCPSHFYSQLFHEYSSPPLLKVRPLRQKGFWNYPKTTE